MGENQKPEYNRNRMYNLFPFNSSGPAHSSRSRLAMKYFLTATRFSKIFCCYFAEFKINASLHLLGLQISCVAISLSILFHVRLWNNFILFSIPWFHPCVSPSPFLFAPGYSLRIDLKHKAISFPWSLFLAIWWIHSLSFPPGFFLYRNVYGLNNNMP